LEDASVHGFKNFARFAYQAAIRDDLQLLDLKTLFAP